MQFGEFVGQFDAYQVGAGTEQLSKLDERRSQFGQRATDSRFEGQIPNQFSVGGQEMVLDHL